MRTEKCIPFLKENIQPAHLVAVERVETEFLTGSVNFISATLF